MRVVWLNGPINSGKTTVGKIVAEKLGCMFVDGDAHGEESDNLTTIIAVAYSRIGRLIRTAAVSNQDIVISYPMRQEDYRKILSLLAVIGADFFCVTLAPPLEIALEDRGYRPLDIWEISRIKEMYAEGYHERQFSDIIIDNSELAPDQTADKIIETLNERFF